MTASSEPQDQPATHDPGSSIGRAVAWVGWQPVVVTLVALAILVWLGRDMTFYHDDYALLLLRDLSPSGLLAPHNEHLIATLVLLYRTLVATVGTVSYWPYLGVTFALHVVVAAIVYVVVRRETTAAWALGAMAVMLLLGSGGDDILWAFQSGVVGATAAGMAAVVVAPRRPALAAVLLTIGLATSGAALAFLVGTALHLVLTRPRALVWLALPVGLYLAWYLTFGATRMVALRSPSFEGVPEYVLVGLVASAAGAVGSVVPAVGSIALLALAFGIGWCARPPADGPRAARLERRVLRHRRPRPRPARCGAGCRVSLRLHRGTRAADRRGDPARPDPPSVAGRHRCGGPHDRAGRQRGPARRQPRPAGLQDRMRALDDAGRPRECREPLLVDDTSCRRVLSTCA